MIRKYKDKTVKPWLMLFCLVVLGVSSYAFYLFVSPRTEKLNGTDSTSSVSSEDSKRTSNGGELSSRSRNNMSRQEYLAMIRERDAELLRGVRGKIKSKRQNRRAFAQSTDPIQKWEQQVAQLRADLKAANENSPELAKDIKRQLDMAIRERPQR
ncbi:MAG: hypothetical protein AAF497_15930 [Planctomycetota bacterium]